MIRRAGRILAALLLAAALFAVLSWWRIDWDPAGAESYPGGAVLRDDAGNVLRVTLGPGDVDCRPTYRADPDDWIAKALVASEDGTFWTHGGVRPLSVLRAAWQNAFCRRRISGASTISMQAVRLMRPHPKGYWWKFVEAIRALKMERVRDKRWILSQYLNRAPFGSNLVGIEAAAQGWFGKGAKDLGLGEAAMLAGMVQSPSRFRPDRHYDRALKRRDYVFGRMRTLGFATDEQLAAAKSVRPALSRAPRPFRAPHYCDWWLSRPKARGDVATALNADIQATAERAVDAAAGANGLSCAAVVMRADTRAVVALACSGDYFDGKAGQVNTALAPRPAGSTLKPFLTALALDRGETLPSERLADVPMAVRGYRPANFDARHRGPVTLRDSLVLSLNIPFVRLLRRVGVETFGENLRALGFSHLQEPDGTFGLGMAIGNVEVTLMELVGAYATLARGGDGVYSRGASYLVSDILSGDERSAAALGHVADVRAPRFAWKTGTSSACRDAWTVAWNPEWVVGVWCGHLSGGFGDTTVVGAKAAAPVAWTIARSLCAQDGGPWFSEPDDVIRRPVCRRSGLTAGACCPDTEPGVVLAGTPLPRLCGVHRLDATGKVVEFHPPDERTLAIAKPEDGARFALVRGLGQQRIVCETVGNPSGSRLWWFVDDRPVGTTEGAAPFVADMETGTHVIACSTAKGDSASVTVTVTDETPLRPSH